MPAQLRFEDVVLRPWSAADHDAIAAIVKVSQKEFDDWLPTLVPSLDDFGAFLRTVAVEADRAIGWTYAIEVDGCVVGQCTVHLREDNTAEVGYWVRSDRNGEGIATRAVRVLSRSAVQHFAAVIIRCDAGNVKSAAVARAAGFRYAGTVDLDPSSKGTSAQTGREMTWLLEPAP